MSGPQATSSGSGGSLWITAGQFAGSGTIHANGGLSAYWPGENGDGGGGRIAIYSCSITMPAFRIAAAPGSHSQNAEPGTVYIPPDSLVVQSEPDSISTCLDTTTVTFHFDVPGGTAFQWRRAGASLTDGPSDTGSFISGSATDTLTIASVSEADAGAAVYDCIVTNACGSVTSTPATLTICIGDFNCDGGIDGTDVQSFFNDWESGNAAADVNADGGVDGGDVSTFFDHWEAGC